jgi:maltooligosyltrehalose synthase
VPRLLLSLQDRSAGSGGLGLGALDARVTLPEGVRGALTDVVTGRAQAAADTLAAAALFADFPVALLAG